MKAWEELDEDRRVVVLFNISRERNKFDEFSIESRYGEGTQGAKEYYSARSEAFEAAAMFLCGKSPELWPESSDANREAVLDYLTKAGVQMLSEHERTKTMFPALSAERSELSGAFFAAVTELSGRPDFFLAGGE